MKGKTRQLEASWQLRKTPWTGNKRRSSCVSHKPGWWKMFVILWTWIISPLENRTFLPHWFRINWNDQDLITVKFRELKAVERWTKFDNNWQEAKIGVMCSVFKFLFWGSQLENTHYLRSEQGSMRTNIQQYLKNVL